MGLMWKRVAIAIVLLGAVLLIAWWLVLGGAGGVRASLEGWAGERLLEFANRHLRAEFAFDRLEYDPPATIVLHGASLTDEGTRVVEARSLSVTLSGIPKENAPFIIEAVSADALVVRLIERADGSLLGFHDMIERAPETAPSPQDGRRPADGFAIRTIGVTGGRFEWHVPGNEPLVLDDLELGTSFVNEAPAGGTYDVSLHIDRKPLAALALDGKLDLSARALEIVASHLAVELAPERYEMLPPALQSFARAHEVRGKLDLTLRGTLPFGGEGARSLTGSLRLEQGSMSFGEYVLPVELLDFDASVVGEQATFERIEVRAFGGALDGTGQLGFAEPWPAQISVRVDGMHLDQALRPRPGAPPRFAGEVTLNGSASMDIGAVADTVRGNGRVEIRKGSLVRLPGFGDLVEAVTGGRHAAEEKEETTANFALVPGEARLRELTYMSTAMAGRGEGEIHFAGTLNVRFNAGPLEKVQSELGLIGDLFGKLTDRILTYQLLGPVEDPTVEVKPLGLGVK